LAYLKSRQYQKSVDDFTRVIRFLRGSSDKSDGLEIYNNDRGMAYQLLGQYQKAIDDFTQAININPSYAAAYYNRGLAYEKLGKQNLAEKDRTKAKELGYKAEQKSTTKP
jgi:tetratricopeptide (TPR) repeat protein